MNRTALVLGIRKHLSNCFQYTHAFVPNDEFDSFKTPSAKPLEETDPTGFVFLHAFGCTQNLTVAILIDGDCHQNRHTSLEWIFNEVDDLNMDEQACLDNMPESLQDTERYETMQNAVDSLTDAYDTLDEFRDKPDEVLASLREIDGA